MVDLKTRPLYLQYKEPLNDLVFEKLISYTTWLDQGDEKNTQ
jgi:hypothetical protein